MLTARWSRADWARRRSSSALAKRARVSTNRAPRPASSSRVASRSAATWSLSEVTLASWDSRLSMRWSRTATSSSAPLRAASAFSISARAFSSSAWFCVRFWLICDLVAAAAVPGAIRRPSPRCDDGEAPGATAAPMHSTTASSSAAGAAFSRRPTAVGRRRIETGVPVLTMGTRSDVQEPPESQPRAYGADDCADPKDDKGDLNGRDRVERNGQEHQVLADTIHDETGAKDDELQSGRRPQ